MSQPVRGQGGHIVFWISPKNTKLVEDVENLLSVQFRWILFDGFIGEVKNVSANQRTGRLSCFSDQPEKRKPGRGCWDLVSCQVLLNSIQRFQRKSWKCLSKSGRPFCFSDPPEKHKLGRGHWDLASYQVSLNSVQWFQRRSRKCLRQSEARAAILIFRRPKKHKLGRGRWDLASYQVSLNSVQRFQRRSRKCLRQSEARADILFFSDRPKRNTNLVEGVEILLPVKFHWIWFSGFRREVENVLANQRPDGHLVFPIGLKNTNLVEGI